jgi:choline dehydrogenase-like flavoprotein
MPDDVIIVGSGPAAVAAALGLVDRGLHPTIVDIGVEAPKDAPLDGNFYRLRAECDVFDVMIGRDLERVRARARHAAPLPAKLTAPRMHFITHRTREINPMVATSFAAVRSFATGGLANGWGAGLYRALDTDLPGFPVRYDELSPHYDRLTREIGISGDRDDLEPFFGSSENLLPPLRLSKKASWLLTRYHCQKAKINAAGFYMGRPRLAVLSVPWSGRSACDYSNLEFWEPNLPFIYTPRFTLHRLIESNSITYRKGLLVERWSKTGAGLLVHAREVATKSPVSLSTRYLVLAAGAIGSAQIVLASNQDYSTALPLLDNSAVQVPLFLLRFIGRSLETDCFGLTQLNLVYKGPEYDSPLQASILEVTSPSRAEFFSSLPFAARDNLRMIRSLVPSMLVLQLFFPAKLDQAARLALGVDGLIRIQGTAQRVDWSLIRKVIKAMRDMRAFSHSSLVTIPPAGQQGIHYAGTLPIEENGGRQYRCNKNCELHGNSAVYVVDGSVCSSLPAKNYSFLVMANAMRVAHHLADRLQGN